MGLIKDFQSLQLDDVVFLFQLSGYNPEAPYEVFYFTNCSGVIYNGIAYTPLACQLEGLKFSSEGVVAQPTLTVSDSRQIISGFLDTYEEIEGSTLKLFVTLKRYLDGQPNADITQYKLIDIFQISQVPQIAYGVEIKFILSSLDWLDALVGRLALPKCNYRYRGKYCTYAGSAMFTINNQPTDDPNLDVCAHTITACKTRFGVDAVLPYGGFSQVRQFG